MEGSLVRQVLIEQGLNIKKEFYLGLILDRATRRIVFMGSREGGMEIEEVAASNPEAIIKEAVDPALGFQGYQGRKMAAALGLDPRTLTRFMAALYAACESSDASLAEINPLVETEEGEILALDAKMNFDDNALFRHPELLSCVTSTKKSHSRSGLRVTASTTSNWTATWAAWSTAPDWRWPPWTSSSWREAIPPISSMSAGCQR